MKPAVAPVDLLQALIDDTCISFNIRRSDTNRSPFPRKVMLLPSTPTRRSAIPGLSKKNEKGLVDELKTSYKSPKRWQKVARYSFDASSSMFSFLWRFRTDPAEGLKPFQGVGPVSTQISRKIKSVEKRFKAHLRAFLMAGNVYLIPDAEVTFNSPGRFKQGYARRVLVLDVHDDQIVMMPFSTQVERMDKKTDILIDPTYKGKRLDPNGHPTVENLDMALFEQKTALIVCAAQPMTRKAFLDGVITPKGSVTRELLYVAREKLKNI